MSQSAILQLETIENAFIVGLLLTGSIEQAERAIVDSIHCNETEDVCGQRVFRRVIQWAVDPQEQRSRRVIDEASIRILPFELGRVLHLPPRPAALLCTTNSCWAIREVCAWLLHMDVEQISHRTQSAVNGVAQVYASIGGSDRRLRFAPQTGSRPVRTVTTMEPAIPRPAATGQICFLDCKPSGARLKRRPTEEPAGPAPIAITLYYPRQT